MKIYDVSTGLMALMHGQLQFELELYRKLLSFFRPQLCEWLFILRQLECCLVARGVNGIYFIKNYFVCMCYFFFPKKMMFVAHSIFWTWNNDNLFLLFFRLVLFYFFFLLLFYFRLDIHTNCLDKLLSTIMYLNVSVSKTQCRIRPKVMHKFECHKHRSGFDQWLQCRHWLMLL